MILPAPDARAAATLVIFRELPGQAPQLLMMERAATMAFAAGALVFPGGAVDAADIDLARRLDSGLPLDEAAARIAAIRETLEESGLALGFSNGVDRFTAAQLRAEMARGGCFADLVAEAGLGFDLDRLVPFARWLPSSQEFAHRVYDTRFYLLRLDENSHEPTIDKTENVHLFWESAQDVLERCDRGEGRIIYPTRRNLERLAQFASFEEATAHACTVPVEIVTPWFEQREDGRYLCIPAHLGYPVTAELMSTARRG